MAPAFYCGARSGGRLCVILRRASIDKCCSLHYLVFSNFVTMCEKYIELDVDGITVFLFNFFLRGFQLFLRLYTFTDVTVPNNVAENIAECNDTQQPTFLATFPLLLLKRNKKSDL